MHPIELNQWTRNPKFKSPALDTQDLSQAEAQKYLPDYFFLKSYLGEKVLNESRLKKDLIKLAAESPKESRVSSCGPEMVTWIFDLLDIAQKKGKATKEDLLNKEMTLEQIRMLFENQAEAEVFYADDLSLEDFKSSIKENLKTVDAYLVVNYSQTHLGLDSNRAFGLIAAYYEKEDYVLIYDVNPSFYEPVWVKVEDLYKAMNTPDSDAPKLDQQGIPVKDVAGNPVYLKRGFVEVSKK